MLDKCKVDSKMIKENQVSVEVEAERNKLELTIVIEIETLKNMTIPMIETVSMIEIGKLLVTETIVDKMTDAVKEVLTEAKVISIKLEVQ